MGIESDQLVFDYLSRVGDLAQQRQLPSATRMRLVTELRGEIDRHRARATVDSPAAVRRILDRLGTPDRIVSGAQNGGPATDPAAPLTRPLPEQRDGDPKSRSPRRRIPRVPGVPRPRRGPTSEPARAPSDLPSPPHLAGTDELGASGEETDWWRIGAGGGSLTDTDSVPGFTGGIEIPDILKPPPSTPSRPVVPLGKPASDTGGTSGSGDGDDEGDAEEYAPRRTRRFMPRNVPRVAPAGGWTNPLLLLAAAALVAGAVLGNVLALLIGWAVVYLSRRLTMGQKKLAVFGMPALAVAGGIGWLWGRSTGRWGDPIAEGQMNAALGETWPWVLRCAAIGSALYLVWRSQRGRV
ncbi:hypothetical protein ACIRF8_00765 [Streptomyces sp. NPDC102406]|uniref:hypothetical protein n=1 Tax=Streptomyces sp. NPDC102406 TaxID=3366171 RepID=UPI00381D30B8